MTPSVEAVQVGVTVGVQVSSGQPWVVRPISVRAEHPIAITLRVLEGKGARLFSPP